MKVADPLMNTMTKEDTLTGEFEFIGGSLALDFTNTLSSFVVRDGERFTEYARLVRWGLEAGVLTHGQADNLLVMADRRPEDAENTLQQAFALREAIHWIFS